jgi:hypothetical protein
VIPARWPWHGRDAEDTQPVPEPADTQPVQAPEPTPRPGGAYAQWLAASRADQALQSRCSCGAATRCDPFAGVPEWPGPDPEWTEREEARLGRLAHLTAEVGPWEAALQMFARPPLPPGDGPAEALAVSPASPTHADIPEPLSASEAI